MACSARSVLSGDHRTPVSVNGVVIPHDAIAREVQNHPAPSPAQAWQAAARALVVRELLLQEARRLGLRAAPIADEDGRRETDEEALIRGLVEREVATPAPDEAACRRYYDNNRGRFRSPDISEVSHILIAARRDRPEAFARARELAAQLLAQARARPETFAELAAAHSECASAAAGGNLGQLRPGAATPEFEAALAALAPGETCAAPVETRYGFHIVRLERRVEGRQLPFEAVQARIAAYLVERSRRLALAQYVARLAARAETRGIDLPAPGDLRVH